MSALAGFFDAFVDAVVAKEPFALTPHLTDACATANAIVYRNTIFRGGADALASAFPAVARMAGSAYFECIAVEYMKAAPPATRSLVGYGETFPAFVAEAPGLDQAPYLADAARLDRAWLEAHLALSREPLQAGALAALTPERLADIHLGLHPSVRLLRLDWTVHDAWKHNRSEEQPVEHVVAPNEQWVLVWRPAFDVESRVLSRAEASFLRCLEHGGALGEAAEAAAKDGDVDISLVFAGALEGGVFDSEQGELDSMREEWW